MKIEIDQSGRTEYTATDTVIADSIGNNIVILAKDKRDIQKIYRLIKKPRIFIINLFSLLISMLIKKPFDKTNLYHIDIEYPGYDCKIRNLIIGFSKKLNYSIDKNQIKFSRIGKKSKAHEYAYNNFKNKNQRQLAKIRLIYKILFP